MYLKIVLLLALSIKYQTNVIINWDNHSEQIYEIVIQASFMHYKESIEGYIN